MESIVANMDGTTSEDMDAQREKSWMKINV